MYTQKLVIMPQHISRRRFLSQSTKTTVAVTAAGIAGADLLAGCVAPKVLGASSAFVGFEQTPLQYAYKDLEPVIDAITMEIHYSKHHAAYVKNLNTAVVGTDAEKMSITEIFANISKLSPSAN